MAVHDSNASLNGVVEISPTEDAKTATTTPTRQSPSNTIDKESKNDGGAQAAVQTKYTWRFWMIFSALALSALLSALESSILSTAMPTITSELGSGGNYIWVINIYFLTRCVPLSNSTPLHCC